MYHFQLNENYFGFRGFGKNNYFKTSLVTGICQSNVCTDHQEAQLLFCCIMK